jgi:hypothetical protein
MSVTVRGKRPLSFNWVLNTGRLFRFPSLLWLINTVSLLRYRSAHLKCAATAFAFQVHKFSPWCHWSGWATSLSGVELMFSYSLRCGYWSWNVRPSPNSWEGQNFCHKNGYLAVYLYSCVVVNHAGIFVWKAKLRGSCRLNSQRHFRLLLLRWLSYAARQWGIEKLTSNMQLSRNHVKFSASRVRATTISVL